MKAARLHAYGAVDAVTLDEIASPQMGDQDVLIRVAAASVNPLDVKLTSGVLADYFPLGFPYVLGSDLAGTIERVGTSVAGWQIGDRVIGRADPVKGGAFAPLAVLPVTHIAPAPANLPLDEAAGLPTAAGTAWQALFETADLRPGQTVLIHAGAGGVGSCAIQLARQAGAKVISTASADNLALLRELGADQAIDYRQADFAGDLRNVDVVLDTMGGEVQRRSFAVLRGGGRLVSIVTPPDEALARQYDVAASFVFHQTDRSRLNQVAGLCEAGKLKPLIDRKMPLAAAAEALAYVAAGHARGKVLLLPAS
ncbi:MAG TPA: NADP-dependent oxidoreductase [Terriglobia bacterium]|nr:NADP-dependent oxidoreductase [Terriglobia bacterium]